AELLHLSLWIECLGSPHFGVDVIFGGNGIEARDSALPIGQLRVGCNQVEVFRTAVPSAPAQNRDGDSHDRERKCCLDPLHTAPPAQPSSAPVRWYPVPRPLTGKRLAA